MTLIFQDSSGAPLTELRFDTPEAVSYKQLLVFCQETDATGVLLKALEAGLISSDASFLGNRALLIINYTIGTQQPAGTLAVGPIAVTQAVNPTNLDFHLLDGILQLSKDTFTWADYLSLGSISQAASSKVYLRYQKNLMGAGSQLVPFITRMVISNIGASPITAVSLTAQDANTQLSLNGIAYSSSVTIGTIGVGSSATIYVSTLDVSNLPYATLNLSDTQLDTASIPFIVPGGRAYTTPQEVRDYVQTIDVSVITTDEEVLDLIFKAANEIDRTTRRRFDVATVTERYDGVGQQKLVLDNYPIIAVQEVQILSPNNTIVTDIKSTDSNFATELIVDYVNGFITLPSAALPQLGALMGGAIGTWYPPLTSYYPTPSAGVPYDYVTHFGRGVSNIAVTYTYGFQTPPEGIRDACKKLVVIELLKKKGTSDTQGLAGESIAGMNLTYSVRSSSGGGGPFGHMIGELQTNVADILTGFRKRRWGVI